MSDSRLYDVVVYGATGFTGSLIVEYLLEKYRDSDLKWAMAGRSAEKLAAVRDELGAPADTPLIVADSGDAEAQRKMAAQSRVVISSVGPYQLYGTELVAACVETGTDYVDLCGEPLWMRDIIETYSEAAEDSGARIVLSCGFDSVPFDLGVFYLQSLAQEKFGKPLSRVRGRVRAMRGEASGGTVASMGATMERVKKDNSLIEALQDPFVLTPGFQGAEQPSGNDRAYEEDIDSWVAPFIMAVINTRNVHRSNALLGHPWGTDFVYDEMRMTGPGEKGEAAAKGKDKSFNADKLPAPGEGPDRAEREAGFYDVLFIGETADGERLCASVAGDLDPGYGSTSRMIAEAALCLAKDKLETKGGVWTTAPAMGHALIKRLVGNAGLRFNAE